MTQRDLNRAMTKTIAAAIAFATTCGSASALAGEIETVLKPVKVTAERREDVQQLVPMSLTVFGNEDLREREILSVTDMATRTPGLAIGTFNSAQPQIYIRGIGSNEDGPAGDPSVGYFIDDVYIGRSAGMAMDFLDLERIEVLRGPQGTLYGKNVTGGLIHTITAAPSDTLDSRVEASYGNLDALTLRGFVTGPLSDRVSGRLSVTHQRRDGYLESRLDEFASAFPGSDPGDLNPDQLNRHRDGIRGKLRIKGAENFTLDLSADYGDIRESGPNRHIIGGDTGNLNAGYLDGYENRLLENLGETAGLTDIETWGLSAKAKLRGKRATLTSITAWRESDARVSEGEVTPEASEFLLNSPNTVPFVSFVGVGGQNAFAEQADQFTQELRLNSVASAKLEWVTGLFFLHEDVSRDESFEYGADITDNDGELIRFNAISRGRTVMDATTKSYAAFGDLTYHIAENLSVAGGLRYTYEEKEIDTVGTAGGLGLIAENFDTSADDSWDDVTPRASITYYPTDSASLYATVAKGFKSGGFQGQPPTAIAATTSFDQEEAWLYELGAKTEWFGQKLRVDVAAFMTDYNDLQVLQLLIPEDAEPNAPGIVITQNAADATIYGAELEFKALPLPGLRLEGSYAWLDATFDEFSVPDGFRAPDDSPLGSRKGNKLRNAPENSLHFLARYEHQLGLGGIASLQGEWRYQSKVFQDPDNLEVASIDAYDLTDFRAAYLTADKEWEIAGWVRNVFDEEFLIHNFPSVGSGFATPGLPRTYGATVTWRP